MVFISCVGGTHTTPWIFSGYLAFLGGGWGSGRRPRREALNHFFVSLDDVVERAPVKNERRGGRERESRSEAKRERFERETQNIV